MTGDSKSPTFGTMVVAWVAVMVVRLPMVVVTAAVAVGVGLVGEFDVGVRRAIVLSVLAWPLWAMILVAGERAALSRRQESGTTRLDVVGIQCLATTVSLLASSALLAGGPAGGLTYGLVVATVMCVVEVLGLTGGRPFSTDWRAPATCSLQHRNVADEPEFGA